MTTGQKLAEYRKKMNYTQEELADILGVSRQAVSRWEVDATFPETEKLLKLSKLYKCSIDSLLNNDSVNSTDALYTDTKIDGRKTRRFSAHQINALAWSWSMLVFVLVSFILPMVSLTVGEASTWFGTITVNITFNGYNILGSSNYGLGNFMFLLSFAFIVANAIISIFQFFFTNRTTIVFRNISATLAFVLFFFVLVPVVSAGTATGAGMWTYFVLLLVNAALLWFLPINQHPVKREKIGPATGLIFKKRYFTLILGIILVVGTLLIYILPFAGKYTYVYMFSPADFDFGSFTIITGFVITLVGGILLIIDTTKKNNKLLLVAAVISTTTLFFTIFPLIEAFYGGLLGIALFPFNATITILTWICFYKRHKSIARSNQA